MVEHLEALVLFEDGDKEMKLYGKNPVLERIKKDPKAIRKIFIQDGHPGSSYIHKKARQWDIPIFSVPKSKLIKIGGMQNTQGIVADVEDFRYVPYEEMLEAAFKRDQSLVFLDGLNDPQNLGAIVRTLACLGSFSIVLPTHDSVEVTEAVLRVACGGENYVTVARVSNLNQAISRAKESGFWIAGAVVQGGQDLFLARLPFPLALVVGSEQKGIREVIKKKLDIALTIPVVPAGMSLNAAHAAALLAYEIKRQKKQPQPNFGSGLHEKTA